MTPAVIELIVKLAPVAVKGGQAIYNAIVDAIHNTTGVSREEIIAVFKPFHDYASLASYEAEKGVTPNPDGSVSPV